MKWYQVFRIAQENKYHAKSPKYSIMYHVHYLSCVLCWIKHDGPVTKSVYSTLEADLSCVDDESYKHIHVVTYVKRKFSSFVTCARKAPMYHTVNIPMIKESISLSDCVQFSFIQRRRCARGL